MNWKKDLTIETKFFEDSIDGIPDAILVPPNHEFIRIETGPSEDQDARNAAEIIERLLSNKLIENFLNCWEILKQAALPARVYRSHHRTSNSSLLSQIRKEEDRYRQRHYTDKVVDTEEIHSSNVGWLQEQREGLYRKTKIAYTHIQRAKLLKQIVQKLKRARSQALMVSENIVRVRSNHRLMSQIRHLEQVANQLQIQRVTNIQAQSQLIKQQKQQNLIGQSKRYQMSKEDQQIEQRLWIQMQLLREQLQGLRLENQNILSSHLTRQDQIQHLRKEKELLIQQYQTIQHQHELLKLQSISKTESISNMQNTQRIPAFQQKISNLQQLPFNSLQPQPSSKQQVDAQFKRQYEKEMAVLHQRIRQMEQRQDLIRTQLMSELKLREQMIKENQRKQRNEGEKIRNNQQVKEIIKAQEAKRQQVIKQSLQKQLRMKEKLMREYAQQQQMLRQQIQRQQMLRQQAKRQHNQREIEIREQNLREFQQRENRIREELIKEYQSREAAIKMQQKQLNFTSQHPLQFVPIQKNSSSFHHNQRVQESHLNYGTEKADRNRSIPRQVDQTKGFGYSTTKTIKTVTQNPVIIWHETSKQQITTKNEYQLTSRARESHSIQNYLEGTKKLEWPKEQQRTEYCGCCF